MARKNDSGARGQMDNVSNAAKTLLANIRFMSVDDPIRTVVITSAIPNEGKTFVAANLAWAMATSGKRTLVVEADMRRRSMANQLQAHAQHGLYSVMAGEVALADAAVPTQTSRLFFLDSEPHIPNPSDLLSSRRFSLLVEQMKREYDYVVFDTPPVGTFVDAAVLGSKVDAVFMVVRERHTHRDEVARATEQLKTANVQLRGVVMNFCERQSSEYYYEYYYKEGPRGRERRRRRKDSYAISSNATDFDAVETAAPAAPAAPVARRTWSNAPSADALGDATASDRAGAQRSVSNVPAQMSVEYGSSKNPRMSIPSIGDTTAISSDEVSKRLDAQN